MIGVSENCIAENLETNFTSVYALDVQPDLLTESTKCYMECILVSIGIVSESIDFENKMLNNFSFEMVTVVLDSRQGIAD